MLEESYPEFLALLDSAPETAFREFYEFTVKLLTANPPFQVRALKDMEIGDLINEVVLHCVRDDFRVLRQYVDIGRPFAGWLYILTQRKCIDRIRRDSFVVDVSAGPDSNTSNTKELRSTDPELNPEEKYRVGAIVETVSKCMKALGQQCQLLLKLAAEEYTPLEIASALGMGMSNNKKIADAMRECRRQLKKNLVARGIDLSAGLPL